MGGEPRKLHRVGDVHAETLRDLSPRVGQHHALDTVEVLQNDRTVSSSPIRGCFCEHECANNLDSKLELLDSVLLRGAGKSTLGLRLAEDLAFPFVE
jgi:hypothetical protein